jgi:hypothetical protein
MVAYVYKPRYFGGKGGRTALWGWHEQKQVTLYEKETKAKRAGDMDHGKVLDYEAWGPEVRTQHPPRKEKLFKYFHILYD